MKTFFGGLRRPKKPRLVFLTHHKCGSSWLRNVLQAACDRNGLRMFHSSEGTTLPSRECEISILTNALYENVSKDSECRYLHVIRNPCSIVLSAYHSHLNTHDTTRWPSLGRQRDLLRQVDVTQGMLLTLSFLEAYEFDIRTPGPLSSLRRWNFSDDKVTTIRMEDIVVQTRPFVEYVGRLGGFVPWDVPNLDPFTFEGMTGRKIGEVDNLSHYRSGSADAWRRELPPAIIAYVRGQFRDLLERYYPEVLA